MGSEAPTYLYNAGEQRMKKYEPDDNDFAEDDTTKYFYTGSAVLYTTNASNELMTENILDPSGEISPASALTTILTRGPRMSWRICTSFIITIFAAASRTS